MEPQQQIKIEPLQEIEMEPIQQVKLETLQQIKVEPLEEIKVESLPQFETESQQQINTEPLQQIKTVPQEQIKIEKPEVVSQQFPQPQIGGMGCSAQQKITEEPTPSHPISNNLCIRNGCSNDAVVNSEWEDEYCSNECVVTHCRNVFSSWVESNHNGTIK